MRTHSRRTWPAFALIVLLSVVGLFILDGAASGVVLLVAMLGLIGACIYALAGEKVQDGAGGVGGPLSWM
jgi:hypothetical protein